MIFLNKDFCEDDEKWLVPVISGSDSSKKNKLVNLKWDDRHLFLASCRMGHAEFGRKDHSKF